MPCNSPFCILLKYKFIFCHEWDGCDVNTMFMCEYYIGSECKLIAFLSMQFWDTMIQRRHQLFFTRLPTVIIKCPWQQFSFAFNNLFSIDRISSHQIKYWKMHYKQQIAMPQSQHHVHLIQMLIRSILNGFIIKYKSINCKMNMHMNMFSIKWDSKQEIGVLCSIFKQ